MDDRTVGSNGKESSGAGGKEAGEVAGSGPSQASSWDESPLLYRGAGPMSGSELKKRRENAGFDERIVAEFLGLDQQEIVDIESGEKELDPRKAWKLRYLDQPFTGPRLEDYRVNVLGMNKPQMVKALNQPAIPDRIDLGKLETKNERIDPAVTLKVLQIPVPPPPFDIDDLRVMVRIRNPERQSRRHVVLSMRSLAEAMRASATRLANEPRRRFGPDNKSESEIIREEMDKHPVLPNPPYTRQDLKRASQLYDPPSLLIQDLLGLEGQPSLRSDGTVVASWTNAMQSRFPPRENGYSGYQFHDWIVSSGKSVEEVAEDLGLSVGLIQFSKALGKEKIPGLVELALDDYFENNSPP